VETKRTIKSIRKRWVVLHAPDILLLVYVCLSNNNDSKLLPLNVSNNCLESILIFSLMGQDRHRRPRPQAGNSYFERWLARTQFYVSIQYGKS
jgi:hypothetical protein